MGIIARQSVINSISTYIGIGIGAIYTIFLVPKIFYHNPDEWGLVQIVISYVQILLPFSLLGIPNIFVKYWPVYQGKQKDDFIILLIALAFTGLIIVSVIFLFLGKIILLPDSNSNKLFEEYFYYIFLILLLQVFFYFFLSYARNLFLTVIPTALKDTFIKLWTFGTLFIYWQFDISYIAFFHLYILGYILQLGLIVSFLMSNGLIKIPKVHSFISKVQIKELLKYGFYSILGSGAAIIAIKLDIIMVGKLMGLEQVAYYATATFFITFLQVPLRSISTITVPIIAKLWNDKELKNLKYLYKKTSIHLLLSSGFIFLMIFINVDAVMIILGEKFGQVKFVIIILSIAKLYEIVNALNTNIILISKYYKIDIVFQVFLLILTVFTNMLLIPKFGMEGAAFATAITLFINSTLRFLFVYRKFGINAYSKNLVKVFIILIICYLLSVIIPKISQVYLSILINSALIGVTFVIFIFFSKVSNEINDILLNVLKKNFRNK